jgi:hypothetical protein
VPKGKGDYTRFNDDAWGLRDEEVEVIDMVPID